MYPMRAATCVLFMFSAIALSTQRTAQSEEFTVKSADIHAWDEVVTNVVADSLASPYVDERKWGKQKNLTVGIRLTRDGLLIKPKRKRKLVNHGDWERFEIRLDPNKKQALKLTTLAVRNHAQADKGCGLEFDARAKLPLKLHARFAKWERGLQLYSVEVLADATVRVDLTCRVDGELDTTQFPPSFRLHPRISKADVQLESFQLHRISNAKGELVKQLGKVLHDVANDQLKKRRQDLVKKINRKLDRWSEKESDRSDAKRDS